MTDAPAAARARAVSTPIPEMAPVTTAVLPDRSTPSMTSAAVVSKPNGVVRRALTCTPPWRAGVPVRLGRGWGASCFIAPCLPSAGATYRGSTGVLSLRPPGGENDLGGVVVAVVDRTARRACPSADLQRQFVEMMAALRARLARRQPARHRLHGAPVAVGLLSDDSHELPPPGIADSSCQPGDFEPCPRC